MKRRERWRRRGGKNKKKNPATKGRGVMIRDERKGRRRIRSAVPEWRYEEAG